MANFLPLDGMFINPDAIEYILVITSKPLKYKVVMRSKENFILEDEEAEYMRIYLQEQSILKG